MIEHINGQNIECTAEAFSASWRFSHNGIVSEQCLDEHSPERMKQIIYEEIGKGNLVCTYVKGSESLGLVSFSIGESHISKLYVNAAYLRRGIGKKLLTYAVEQMNKGIPVSVNTLNTNARAIKFYESLGFVYSGKDIPFEDRTDIFQKIYLLVVAK